MRLKLHFTAFQAISVVAMALLLDTSLSQGALSQTVVFGSVNLNGKAALVPGGGGDRLSDGGTFSLHAESWAAGSGQNPNPEYLHSPAQKFDFDPVTYVK